MPNAASTRQRILCQLVETTIVDSNTVNIVIPDISWWVRRPDFARKTEDGLVTKLNVFVSELSFQTANKNYL